MTEQASKPSLHARLLRQIMLPLALVWLTGTVIAVAVASFFTQQAYDRSLLDDAYLMAANVRIGVGGNLEIGLTAPEMSTLLYQSETEFFAIIGPDGKLVAGTEGLNSPEPVGQQTFRFSYVNFNGQNLRAVALKKTKPVDFQVVVAQTTLGRRSLLQRLLAYSVAPQIALLLLLAFILRRAIAQETEPLAELRRAMDQRDARDLRPVQVDTSTSDLQTLGAALNSLLRRLDDSVRAQREFAGNVAHELRTPLAGIRALANYGLAKKEPAVWRDQLERIVHSEGRASRLVDQLLAMALANEACAALVLKPLPLHDLVRDAVLRFLPRADAAGVDLGALGVEEDTLVLGDQTLLEGLLNNLIDNALRYGRSASDQHASITVAVSDGPKGVCLSVIDNGPGLPEGAVPQLAARWMQGQAGLELGQGAGLGLAIVARYAELLNAPLSLAQGPDARGACITVILPRAEPLLQRTQ